jgi:Zn-dependent oligopeptidase
MPPHLAPPDAAAALVGTPEALTAGCRGDIVRARAAADRLAALPAPRDAAAALDAYDAALGALGDAGARASLCRNVHPDAAMRDAAERCESEIERAATELSLDRRLYDALASLSASGLDHAARHLLEKALRDFRRSGVDRDEATRVRVRQLRDELVAIGQEFGRNIKDDVRRLEVLPAELEGVPEDWLRARAPGPDGRVTVSTDNADYVPVVTYARSARVREALWRLYRLRGHPKNLDVLARMLARRAELARLLGYPSWAAYVAEDKMIGSDAAAAEFIAKVSAGAERRMRRDHEELVAARRAEVPGADGVPAWDSAYYQDRVKAERHRYDARLARPYFEYRRAKEGVLAITGRLFGVTWRPAPDAPRWHPEVEAYDLLEEGRLLGRVYLDMHPRDGKYKHYAQFSLASGQAGRRVPEGALVCNFPRPGDAPALLEHGDVRTLLHELGHLLHHVLGGHVRFASQAGVATEWDFVEAPSQLLEEWVWDPKVLATFARHVDTGEPIPAELVRRMRAADEFGKGLWVRQQMFYAAVSLELHRRDPGALDPTRVVAELQEAYTPFRHVDGTYFQLSFGHLDGYSAIYYTYMWSLVIAKDLFGAFRKDDLLDPEPAARYRRAVLEPGGSRPAAELVQAFLGRPFSFDAFSRWLDTPETG